MNIQKSQEEYLELLIQHKENLHVDNISIRNICGLLDEIKCFWLERLKIIEFELEELTKSKMCLVLSGAIYLDISDYEHYYFKAFGDCHLLYDPLLKMEMMLRIPEDKINLETTINYFIKVYSDTIAILTTYKNQFYILPLHEMSVEEPEKHIELLNTFFWKFVSSIFHFDFENNEMFCAKYHTFEEIEKDLDDFARDRLIFTDFGDSKLSLRERVGKHSDMQAGFSSLIKGKSEPQIFLISLFSYVSQIVDILYVCSILSIYPYIRFNVTMSYFTMVMYTFIGDEKNREMFEKTLVCYLFYKTIDAERFKKIVFSEFCKRLEDKSIMNAVLEKIQNLGIDIFKDDTDRVVSIINEEFRTIL